MAVKIRLKRMGKIRAPFYRVVVMDSRTKRDGRAIEEIGKYHPTADPSVIQIDSERAQYWLSQGAQPTEPVMSLLKITGDWQKHKGLPGAEGTLKVAEAKPSKKELYDAAVAAAGGVADDSSGATTAKKKSAKSGATKSDAAKSGDAKTETSKSSSDSDSSQDAAPQTVSVDLIEEGDTSSLETVSVSPDGTAITDTEAPIESAEQAAATLVGDAAAELPKGAVAPLEDGSAPEGYTVKGNADSGKYHEEGGRWYDQTVAEMWFKSAADAEAAGFTKAGS